ncbi:MAG: hypothetical protein AAGI44_11160 [Pseudomonadota bacterium]
MNITLNGKNEARVREAMRRRAELLRMRTAQMPRNYREELERVNRIIAAAVSHAVHTGSGGR